MPTPEPRSNAEEISADSRRSAATTAEHPKALTDYSLADLKAEMERRGWQCLRLQDGDA